MDEWHFLTDALPNENRMIEATTQSGDVVHLRRKENRFYTPHMMAYVNYAPVKWRYADGGLCEACGRIIPGLDDMTVMDLICARGRWINDGEGRGE